MGHEKVDHRDAPHAPRFPARQVDRNNAERTRSGGKEADRFRPDIASRDAPRFRNAGDAFPFAGRSPDSSVEGHRQIFGPGPLAFPFADKRTVAFGADRTDLPLRGQCRDGRGLTPGCTGFPFHPAHEESARRTPAALIIATLAAGARRWADLL